MVCSVEETVITDRNERENGSSFLQILDQCRLSVLSSLYPHLRPGGRHNAQRPCVIRLAHSVYGLVRQAARRVQMLDHLPDRRLRVLAERRELSLCIYVLADGTFVETWGQLTRHNNLRGMLSRSAPRAGAMQAALA